MTDDKNEQELSGFEVHQRMLAEAHVAMDLPDTLPWEACLNHMAQLCEIAQAYREGAPFIPEGVPVQAAEAIPLHSWETFEGGKRFSAEGGYFYFFDGISDPKWVPEAPSRSMGSFMASIPGIIQGLSMGQPGMPGGARVVAFPGGRAMEEPIERFTPRAEPYELDLDYLFDESIETGTRGPFELDDEGVATVLVPRRLAMITPVELPFVNAKVLGVRFTVDGPEEATLIVEDISFAAGFNLLPEPVDLNTLPNDHKDGLPRHRELYLPIPSDKQGILTEPQLVRVLLGVHTAPVKVCAALIVQVLA